MCCEKRGVTGAGSKPYDHVIGLGDLAVPGDSVARVKALSQKMFSPERLVIQWEIGQDFDVLGLRIGETEQLKSTDPIPAIVFAELSFGPRLKTGVVMPVGDFVTVVVHNRNPAERLFKAAIIGPLVGEG
jgi:hypothetical protein